MPVFTLDELTTMLADAGATPSPPVAMPGYGDQLLDQTPRARKCREITRIANMYRWQEAITLFLDSRGAEHLSDLTDPQVDDLLDRMHGYVDAAETGCSLVTDLPAC